MANLTVRQLIRKLNERERERCSSRRWRTSVPSREERFRRIECGLDGRDWMFMAWANDDRSRMSLAEDYLDDAR